MTRSPPLSAYLRGVGLWTPAYANFEAWVAAGQPAELAVSPEQSAASRPAAELLHPRLRRRTSVLTRATVTALEAATGQGGAALDSVRLVLVSSLGEIEATVELLAQLGQPHGPVSPTKFHNSVHNTATGYMSIASGNHREATALAGGPHNLEIGALELFAGLAIDGGDAVLLLAEERIPAPFDRADADPTFALALHFGAEPAGPSHPSSLDLRAQLDPSGSDPKRPGLARARLPSMVAPMIEVLRALARLSAGEAGPSVEAVGLASARDPEVEHGWTLSLEAPA